MLNLNKHTKTTPKLNPTLILRTAPVCAYHCAQLLYNTTQHRTVLIIFPLILQTIFIAQMMSTGGVGYLRLGSLGIRSGVLWHLELGSKAPYWSIGIPLSGPKAPQSTP